MSEKLEGGKCYLRHVRLNRQGYESGKYGRYWGMEVDGYRLWRCEDQHGNVHHVRDYTREGAKEQIRHDYPTIITFYR